MKKLILGLCLWSTIAVAETAADKRAALDKMLDSLHTATTEPLAARLEERITKAWITAGTPAVTLLMARGLRSLESNDLDEALASFSDAIVLAPDLAEPWHQRAIARAKHGDTEGAIEDLKSAIRLEPRHFRAWAMLAEIAEKREDWQTAYDAWQQVLTIDPRTPHGTEKEKDLKRKAFGDHA